MTGHRTAGDRTAGARTAGAPTAGPAEALAERLSAWLRTLPAASAVDRLTQAGVAAVVARKQSDMAGDRSLVEAGYLHALPREDGGVYYLPGRLAFFSRTQREDTLAGPGIGEHSRQVLAEVGIDGAQIDELISAGVVVEGGPYRIKVRPNYR